VKRRVWGVKSKEDEYFLVSPTQEEEFFEGITATE
jgi:hypothetical protein